MEFQSAYDPYCTVILFCEHAPSGLTAALDAVGCQAGLPGPVEVLVLDPDGDPARVAAAAAAGARCLSPCPKQRAAAWNEGLRLSAGPRVAFTDDDCRPDPTWLARLGRALDRGALLAGGPDRAPVGLPRFLRHLDYVLTSPLGTAGLRTGGRGGGDWYPRHWNLAADRPAVLRLGGVTAALPEAWDLDLAERIRAAGGEVAFVPEAVVEHRRETGLAGFVRRAFTLARSRAALPRPRWIHAAPLMAAAVVCLALAAAIVAPAAWWIPAGLLLGYASLLAVAGVHATIRQGDPAALAGVPLLLLAQHAAHAAGFTFGLVDRLGRTPPAH